ncbi:MAG: cyclic nucleotide-binding domain-containing protein [Deltaproteobacteria bacterium]|nr:cyclic nucleotide-binding domain-containing protein [Deltaproteobacteria bacterium]
MSISTEELHDRADDAAAAGDFIGALRFAAEILRVSPRDHQARVKIGLSFGAIDRPGIAVDVLLTTAESLLAGGFVLSAIAVCRAAFSFGVDLKRVRGLLARIHPMIAGVVSRERARVTPPAPPFLQVEETPDSLLTIASEAVLLEAAQALALSIKTDRKIRGRGDGDGDGDGADDGVRSSSSLEDMKVAVPLFSDLSVDAFVSLVERLGYVNLGPDEIVIQQGSTGSSVYVLLQGEVEVSSENDGHHVLARLGPGSLFGEMALITQKPRSATVRTTQPSELFEIDRSVVESVAMAYPTVVDEVVQFARRRLLMNLMATSPLFSALDDEERVQMLKAFMPMVIEANQVVIKESASAPGLHLVLEGEFEVSALDPAGDRLVLAYLRAGDVFGEISLIAERETTATVRATEKSVVLMLEKSRFDAFIETHPRLREYLATLSRERMEGNEGAMSQEGVVLEVDDLIML